MSEFTPTVQIGAVFRGGAQLTVRDEDLYILSRQDGSGGMRAVAYALGEANTRHICASLALAELVSVTLDDDLQTLSQWLDDELSRMRLLPGAQQRRDAAAAALGRVRSALAKVMGIDPMEVLIPVDKTA